ncbi:MAG: hypothetical protein CMP20_10305 [Rickettsiales bacterium]|nr:hypothetical protein [Rickettsiales bacterium]
MSRRIKQRKTQASWPLVWDPSTEVVFDEDATQDRFEPKNFESAAWNRPLNADERHELLIYDVSRPDYRFRRLDQGGATLVRDAGGFGYNKNPHNVALQTAGKLPKSGASERLQQIFAYGHWIEAVNKSHHREKSQYRVEDTGFWANPAFEGNGDKDEWFKENWPFLYARLRGEHDALPEEIRNDCHALYVERRDAVVDMHWLVTTPDAVIHTDWDANAPKPYDALHDPEVYGFRGVGECKGHINNTLSAFSNRGALVQMAAQSLCMMKDEEYETGDTVPWGHLLSSSCVTPLSRYWERPGSRKLFHMDAWMVKFTGHNLFFELMEVMRRFKETVDSMRGKTLAEAKLIPFKVETVFSLQEIEIEHLYTIQADSVE